jgi:hypothetical protein
MVFLLCGCDIGVEAPTSLMPLNFIASSNLHGNGHAPLTHTCVAPVRTYDDCYNRTLATSCGGKFRPIITPRETLWCQLFLNPSQWWDCRLEKVNARYSYFKYKNTDDGL